MKFVTHLYIKWVRAKMNVLALVSKAKAAESAFRVFCTPTRKSRKRPSAILARAEELEFTLNGKRVRGYRWNRGKK